MLSLKNNNRESSTTPVSVIDEGGNYMLSLDGYSLSYIPAVDFRDIKDDIKAGFMGRTSSIGMARNIIQNTYEYMINCRFNARDPEDIKINAMLTKTMIETASVCRDQSLKDLVERAKTLSRARIRMVNGHMKLK